MIKFVADMGKAVKFYREILGLKLKFESPGWSEFVTGETTLALHPASDKNPAGKVELGFTVADVEGFYRDMSAKGVLFSMPPTRSRISAECWPSSLIPKAHIAAWGRRRRDYSLSTRVATSRWGALSPFRYLPKNSSTRDRVSVLVSTARSNALSSGFRLRVNLLETRPASVKLM